MIKLIDQGADVEREHTNSIATAKQIARDHLAERPDYYKMLKKIEEESTTAGVTGLGYTTGTPAGVISSVADYTNGNAMSYVDFNGNKLAWMKKHTKGHNIVGFKDYDPTLHIKEKEVTMNEEKDPCWMGYKMLGMKNKRGKEVPNCVPVDENNLDEIAMAMPPQIEPPTISRPAPSVTQRQSSTRTTTAQGRLSGQGGAYTARTQIQRAAPARAPSFSQGASGTMSGNVKATSGGLGRSAEYSRNLMSKMSDGLDKVSRGMSKSIPAAAEKASPIVSRGLGTAARVAGGPAATAAMAVMTPTPANAGEDEKKRQDTISKYNPYKPSGRSIDDYEKQQVTRKSASAHSADEAPRPKADVPTPPSRPNYFSRGQAFSAARGEAGGGQGKFSYDDKQYQTNVKGEPYKPSSQLKQTSIKEAVMDTNELINEALDNILENDLVSMKENLMAALQEKATEKLDERKRMIAAEYFAQ